MAEEIAVDMREENVEAGSLLPSNAAVLRQGRFMPLASAAALVAGLEAECRLKQDGRKAMGFV